MAEKMPEIPAQQVMVRPIGRIKKSPGFFENPIVQDIIEGLIIPFVKSAILTIGERLLFGDQGAPNVQQGSGRVSYRSHFEQQRKYGAPARQQDRFKQYQTVRSQFPQLEDLVFRNEEDATLVVNALYDRIEEYMYATVSDLYDVVGLPVPDYTYAQFGWNQGQLGHYELSALPSGGVRLILPRPFPITQ